MMERHFLLKVIICCLSHCRSSDHMCDKETLVMLSFTSDFQIIHSNEAVVFLWSPYVIGQTIIFLPCDFCLLSIFLFFLA